MLVSLKNVAGFSTADAVIPDVCSVLSGVGLLACCCWLHYMYSTFASIPAFPGVSTVLAVMLLLSFLLMWVHGRAIAVILAVTSCWCHSCCLCHCCSLCPYCCWLSCYCSRPFSSCIMFFTVAGFPCYFKRTWSC